MEIEKEVKKMTLGHEFGAGASCLKCKDKCEGFELHFWRKICRNCKCGLTEHDVSMGSEENKKVGKLFEDTKYTGLIAKLKTDGIPRYQAKMVTITLPSVSSRAHSIQPHTASSIQSPAATAGSTQLAGASVGSAKTRASGAASTGAGGAASIGAGAAASTGPVGAASPGAGGVASTGTGGAASNGIGVPVKADKLALSVSGVSSANTEPVQKDVPMKSVTLEWIPPVERKLAALYIELLPPERRPVAGTEGAAYRRKQMARQLPEHDQDPSKCHELSPAEVKKMQQFVRKYKDEALGVGDVLLPEDMALILAGRQASGGAGGVPGVGGVGGIGRATGVGGTPGAGGVGRAGGVGGTAGSDGAGGFGGAPGVGGVAGIGGTSRAGGVGRFAGTQGAGGVGGVAGVPGVPGAGGVGGISGAHGAGGVGAIAGVPGAGGVGGIAGVPGVGQSGWGPTGGAVGAAATAGAMGFPGMPLQNFACHHCQKPMLRGEPAVYAERAGYDKLWHPACFVCCTCNELLVDMIYFFKKGKMYCGRHYGDSEKPRCGGCDELIFSNEYTQAENQNWHLKHFCCFDCDCILAGETYVMESDKPVCQPCYMKNHAVKCSSCQAPVEPEAQRVSYGDHHWHAEPQCFKCSGCSKCLMGQRFMAVQSFLFCSVECKKKTMT